MTGRIRSMFQGFVIVCFAGLLAGCPPKPMMRLDRETVDVPPLMQAIRDGDLIEVRRLVEDQGQLVDPPQGTPQFWFHSPLSEAIQCGYAPIASYLLEHGASLNPQDGANPLSLAVAHDHLACVRLLLDAGAPVNTNDPASYSQGPLVAAIENHRHRMIELLIAHGAAVDVVKDGQLAPLFYACRPADAVAVRILLDHGADVHCKDSYGRTPLHLAAKDGLVEIAGLLLKRNANVSATDQWGTTPLHLASNAIIAQALLDSGANIKARAEHGHTPLHSAAEGGRVSVVRLLLHASADSNATTDDGKTPLQLAIAANEHRNDPWYNHRYVQVIEMLKAIP